MKTFVAIIALSISINSFSQTNQNMVEIQNFDFLIGNWTIINKRLKERLNNSNEWTEFPASMETKSILNGLGTMDEFKTSYFEDEFVGLKYTYN